jgi:hypothetical protein
MNKCIQRGIETVLGKLAESKLVLVIGGVLDNSLSEYLTNAGAYGDIQ